MKRFIDMKQSRLYVFLLFLLICLCSVSYTANEYSIYHLCSMTKDFHFFSRVIIVQDFETRTFYVLFLYKLALSVL